MRHALQIAVTNLMPVRIIDLFEAIEIDPMQGKTQARVVALELALKVFTELEAVGNAGQRIMARKPFDLIAGLANCRHIFLNIDPSTAGDRSHSFEKCNGHRADG